MAEPEAPHDAPEPSKPPVKGPGKGDLAAFGIGCLVFIIFFAAIITVGVMRE
ncbi:MAG: hypothetical protein JWN04_1233 [Myxococcaceae bacterium]|nr:hypothetical protein [Myxococcaceae bacterium]